MSNKEERIINLYSDGLSLKSIELDVKMSKEDIVGVLKEYRKSQLSKGRYSEDLMILVASRDSTGAKRKDIMEDLGISRSFMVRAIEEYGLLVKSKEGDEEVFYMNVGNGYTFKDCPMCKSLQINEIQTGDGILAPSGIYCMSCGNEFTLKDNTVNIIKWEHVD